jgi:hypothetical protein
MDLARAPRRRPLTARKKGSGYENAYNDENSFLLKIDKGYEQQKFLVKW